MIYQFFYKYATNIKQEKIKDCEELLNFGKKLNIFLLI